MAGNKTKILIILFTLVLFSFTLKDDRCIMLDMSQEELILQSIFSIYSENRIIKVDFFERVYIPFLEKWSEFKGSGYYQLGTKYFNFNFRNQTEDNYISNGENIFVESLIDGKRETQVYEMNDDPLFLLFPNESRWEYFEKTIYNVENNLLIVLEPKLLDYDFSDIEFLFDQKTLTLKEVVLKTKDGRILYFKINKIEYPGLKEEEINKIFRK